MLYKCEYCDYTSKRLSDVRRHENKKIPCYQKQEEDQQPCNLIVPHHDTSLRCSKCNREFNRKDNLKRHESLCDGFFDKKQCKICTRRFVTQQGKWKHMRYVKCSPPSAPTTSYNQTINNNNNNNNNINTNIVNINIRGDFDTISRKDIEDIVKQLEQSEYIKMIQENMSKGKYVIPRTIEQIYFNDDYPQMQTLKKERRNDTMVEVLVDGKWETRMVDDVMVKLVNKVEDYHREYFKYLEDKYQDIPIGSKEWNQAVRPIKTFGHIMAWYKGFSGADIENMGVEINFPWDEKEIKARNRDMAKILKEKIYESTHKPSTSVVPS